MFAHEIWGRATVAALMDTLRANTHGVAGKVRVCIDRDAFDRTGHATMVAAHNDRGECLGTIGGGVSLAKAFDDAMAQKLIVLLNDEYIVVRRKVTIQRGTV